MIQTTLLQLVLLWCMQLTIRTTAGDGGCMVGALGGTITALWHDRERLRSAARSQGSLDISSDEQLFNYWRSIAAWLKAPAVERVKAIFSLVLAFYIIFFMNRVLWRHSANILKCCRKTWIYQLWMSLRVTH